VTLARARAREAAREDPAGVSDRMPLALREKGAAGPRPVPLRGALRRRLRRGPGR